MMIDVPLALDPAAPERIGWTALHRGERGGTGCPDGAARGVGGIAADRARNPRTLGRTRRDGDGRRRCRRLGESGSQQRGPCDGDIVYGEVISCTVPTATTVRDLTFTAAVGDRVRVRVIVPAAPSTRSRRSAGEPGPCARTRSPTSSRANHGRRHPRLARRPQRLGTGSFSTTIQRLNDPTPCPAIAFGPTGVTGSIVGPLRSTAAPASARSASAGASASSRPAARPPVHEVVRPDGTTVCAATGTVESSCLLDTAGTHRILLTDNSGSNTGDYRVVLEKFPAPVGCTALTFGTPVTATVDDPGELRCFTFTGPTPIRSGSARSTRSGAWNPVTEVFRADGTTVCANTFADELTCALTSNGTHTIIVRDGPATARASAPQGWSPSASTTPPPVRRSPSGPPG